MEMLQYYTESFFLPLARLLFITFLPPGELILTRNPCVLLRFLFLGRYVVYVIVISFCKYCNEGKN